MQRKCSIDMLETLAAETKDAEDAWYIPATSPPDKLDRSSVASYQEESSLRWWQQAEQEVGSSAARELLTPDLLLKCASIRALSREHIASARTHITEHRHDAEPSWPTNYRGSNTKAWLCHEARAEHIDFAHLTLMLPPIGTGSNKTVFKAIWKEHVVVSAHPHSRNFVT